MEKIIFLDVPVVALTMQDLLFSKTLAILILLIFTLHVPTKRLINSKNIQVGYQNDECSDKNLLQFWYDYFFKLITYKVDSLIKTVYLSLNI
jgi:hypothetical protein